MNHGLDDLIGRVAREMTNGEPERGLRGRVVDRLPSRGASWMRFRLSFAAAGLIVAALAAAPAVRDAVTFRAPAVVGPATAPVIAEAVRAVSEAPDESGTALAPARVTRRLSPAEVAWLERRVPALDSVEALEMIDIGPAPILVPALDVKPLPTEFVSGDDKARER